MIKFQLGLSLDIEQMPVRVRRADAAIEIILEGDADQARDRIGKLLGEIFSLGNLSLGGARHD